MTRQEATELINQLKEQYGDEYRTELGNRSGCDPEEYDDYGMVFLMQLNAFSRKALEGKAKEMKGHGEELFVEEKRNNNAPKTPRLEKGDPRRKDVKPKRRFKWIKKSSSENLKRAGKKHGNRILWPGQQEQETNE